MAQHRVVELERVLELVEGLVADLDVHQHVVRLEHLGDRVRQLAPAPILDSMDHAAALGDRVAVTLDHRGHLLALIGVNNENDLVMAQVNLLMGEAPRMGARRWSKGSDFDTKPKIIAQNQAKTQG